LVDVRNLYETRIGRFELEREGIQTLNPTTRKFSDFTRWVDANTESLSRKTIFSYCTGGVRCEMATKYLQYKGINNCYQLHGGICSYMDAFPDGGFFKGKNFVYDPRIAVSYTGDEASKEVVGKCAICDILYDDYTAQIRCKMCRMLVLCCDTCRTGDASKEIVCEHCHLYARLPNSAEEPLRVRVPKPGSGLFKMEQYAKSTNDAV
jgi:predicted sulfurtransferase